MERLLAAQQPLELAETVTAWEAKQSPRRICIISDNRAASAKSCRLPSPVSPQKPGAGGRGHSRHSLPKADGMD